MAGWSTSKSKSFTTAFFLLLFLYNYYFYIILINYRIAPPVQCNSSATSQKMNSKTEENQLKCKAQPPTP